MADVVEGDALYAKARESGLDFGPAFRGLAAAWRGEDGSVEVLLTSLPEIRAMVSTRPAWIPASTGLITLFAARERERAAFLPVRFDEARLFEPGAEIERATIRVRRCDDRVIVADLDLFDRRPAVATLRGVRCQAVRSRGPATLSDLGLTARWIPATAELAAHRSPAAGKTTCGSRGSRRADVAGTPLLLEGWATAAAFEFARALANDGGVVDIKAIFASGGLPEARRAWAETIFAELGRSGLMLRSGRVLRLADIALPPADAVFSTLAAQHPDRAPELLLAARRQRDAASPCGRRRRGRRSIDAAVEGYELRSVSAVAAVRALEDRLETIPAAAGGVALRVLLVGAGPATARLLRFAAARDARVTVFDADPRRLERDRLNHADSPEISFCGDLDGLADGEFDLVVSAGGFPARLRARSPGVSRASALLPRLWPSWSRRLRCFTRLRAD